jgi:hypothetical protein
MRRAKRRGFCSRSSWYASHFLVDILVHYYPPAAWHCGARPSAGFIPDQAHLLSELIAARGNLSPHERLSRKAARAAT